MTKRCREADPGDAAAEMAELNTVFVDTSLDTHLVMLVCSSDTAADFKKKVALEHMQCFPEIGEIQVHSVKVKRKSNFYHLPDIMLVWSAFHGVERNWFLSVDASSIHTCHSIRNSLERGTSSGVKIGITNIDDDCRGFISDANRDEILPLALPDVAAEKNTVLEIIAGPNVEKPLKKTTDSLRSIYSEEHIMGAESHAKKKRKVRHTEDARHNPSLGDGGAMFHPDGKDGKLTMSDSFVKVSGVGNDQYDVEGRLVFKGTSPPTMTEKGNLGSAVDSQNLNGSDRRKEDNGFESMVDYGLGQDVPTQHSGVVSIMVLDSSARLMDASAGGADVNAAGSKRKKKKVKKTAAKIQDTIDIEQIGKGERIESSTDTHKCDKMEGKGLSLEHDREVIMPSNSKAAGHVDPDLTLKEASLLQGAEKSSFSIVNPQKLLDSDERKEDDVLESKMDYELDQDVPTVHSGGVCTNMPDPSAGLMDASGCIGDVNTDGKKRKKKKVQKTTTKVPDTREVVQIGKGEIRKPHTETINSEEKEEEKGLFLEHDNEAILPSNSKAPGHVDPDLALKEASLLQDAEKSSFSIVNPQKLLDSDERKEDDVLAGKMDFELDQDVPTVHSGGVCTNMPDPSTGLMDASGCIGDVNTDGKKRKTKKVQKTAAKVPDTRDVEQIGKSEMEKPLTETLSSEEKEEEKGLSLKHDNEVILPSNSKAPDHVAPDLALKDASFKWDADADAVMEPEIPSDTKKRKKKKRQKKLAGTGIENSDIAEIHNGIRGSLGLPSPSSDHIPKETGKEESIRLNEGKDALMKLLDGSNHDEGKVRDVNRKEADLVIKTQTEQTLEDVSVGNKKMVEKTKSSAGDCHADFPTAETENAIVESNQADKDKGNSENRDRKATKKKKKQKHTATDVQDNFPVKDQQVGIELLATKETSIGFVNSEQEAGHLDSSQVMSRKSEEKVDEMHELVVNTDDLAENSGKGTDGINFKQYFVPSQLQNKVDSGDKVRKGTKLKRSSKKAKDNDLASVNISTELQNSIKSLENKKNENNSYRKDNGRTKCDSAQNFDWDKMSPNSLKRSSEAPEKEVKDSSPSELCKMTLQKPNGIVAASSFQNKNPSLDKSSSERSETLHSNRGNERLLLGLNVTNTMLIKTPKKNLFAKAGAIFKDNSGESSEDESGIMHSVDSTRSPSDSSSMSGDSAGESELSQNSTSKGSNDANMKSTGRRNKSKLDPSALNDMTMDFILRSSKRFKKAKQLASQSESQPIEFVPDSQPP